MTTQPHSALGNYLLSSSYSFPSAKLIRNCLIERGVELKLTAHEERMRKYPLVRYGNSNIILWEKGEETKLNSPKIIRLTSNKKRFSDILLDVGIDAPKFELLVDEKLPDDFPVVVRETLTSCGGRGIHIIEKQGELESLLNKGFYWTPYIFMDFELRVHILGGTIVKVFKKIREDGLEEERYPIRNNERGYHFSSRKVENCPKLVDVITQINDALPEKTYFMALDVGWNPDSKKYFILEGNSAPGLNENTACLYADYIYKTIKGE